LSADIHCKKQLNPNFPTDITTKIAFAHNPAHLYAFQCAGAFPGPSFASIAQIAFATPLDIRSIYS